MKIRWLSFILVLLFFNIAIVSADENDNYAKTIKTFKESPVVKPFFSNSYGYAVFPTIGKGGIGIGGAHGSGQVYVDGKLTGKTSMTQVNIGFQFGGQAFSQIIFFEDQRAYKEYTSGEFEFSAQASAVAITAGAQAKAGTGGATAGATAKADAGKQAEVGYQKGMAVFTFAKGGLMYEASIGGQAFGFEPIKEGE
jgi:lipid-binding SYLF domain-containing protein